MSCKLSLIGPGNPQRYKRRSLQANHINFCCADKEKNNGIIAKSAATRFIQGCFGKGALVQNCVKDSLTETLNFLLS